MRSNVLFNKKSIFDVLEAQQNAVKQKITNIPTNQILNVSEHDLLTSLLEEVCLDVPVLLVDEIYIAEASETQVDARYLPNRMIFDSSRPVYIPGNRTVIAVPFKGDEGFFDVQPQTYSSNPPQAEIEKKTITYVRTS